MYASWVKTIAMLTVVSLTMMLGGCAPVLTDAQWQAADFGPPPSPQLIRNLNQSLASGQILSIRGPYKVAYWNWMQGKWYFGWRFDEQDPTYYATTNSIGGITIRPSAETNSFYRAPHGDTWVADYNSPDYVQKGVDYSKPGKTFIGP